MHSLHRAGICAALQLACLVGFCSPVWAADVDDVECVHVAATQQQGDPMSGDDQAGSGTGGTGIYAQQGSGSGGTGITEPSGTGAGGTGISSVVEPGGSGTGGTGIYAQQGSGAGGTGLASPEEGGIGGSGIFGTVMAFGSVCVNGLKIEYDGDTPIETNGLTGRVEDLALGQIVRIETGDEDPDRARQISIDSPLSGPVNRIEPERQRLFIMGAEVRMRPDVVIRGARSQEILLTDLYRGTHVEVSGLRRSDGVLMASRLDVRPAGTPIVVTGIAVPVSRSTFYVGRVRGQLAPGESIPSNLRRQRVQIRGNWNVRSQTLEDVSLRAAPTYLAGMREVSIQGYVAPNRGPGDFKIADTRLSVLDGSTEIRSFDVDALVHVRGYIDEDGRLRARRIVIEERGGLEAAAGVAPNAAIAKDQEASLRESTLGGAMESIEDRFDSLSAEDRKEIEERLEAARAEVSRRAGRIERAEIEERVERIDRDDVLERVERVERFEREERLERVEKDVRHRIEDRIDRYR
jgi:hypothetical protein